MSISGVRAAGSAALLRPAAAAHDSPVFFRARERPHTATRPAARGLGRFQEFVEFLEMGLNGLEDPVKQKAAENQGYQDAVRGGGSAGAAGSGAGAKGSSGAGAGGGAGARRPPPPPPKPAEESVDDLLKKMKKEMGLE